MIVVLLKGGLGNQMFQYAAGRHLADKLHNKLFMDLSWFDLARQVDAPRHYELDCFKLDAKFIKRSHFALAQPGSSLKIKAYRYTKGLFKPRISHFIEQNDQYDKGFKDIDDNTLIEGFFANEKYFGNIRDKLLDDFIFKEPVTERNKKLLEKISKVNSVSVHVRRGDYATIKATKNFHGLIGLIFTTKPRLVKSPSKLRIHIFLYFLMNQPGVKKI